MVLEIILRLVLIALYFLGEELAPFNRLIPRPAWDRIVYPHKENTVPIWLVALLAFILPLLAVIATSLAHYHYINRKGLEVLSDAGEAEKSFFKSIVTRKNFLTADLLDVLLSYSLAVCLNGVITDFIKLLVGRPRPDFFNRCYPQVDVYDSQAVFAQIDLATKSLSELDCSQGMEKWGESIIKDGRKSFPSGHTSSSFAAFGFVSFYLWGKVCAFNKVGKTQSWRFLTGFPPLFLAIFVGISRTQDYRHHWEDVTVGAIIGIVSAYFSYRVYYPELSCDLANLSIRQCNWLLDANLVPQNVNRETAEKWRLKRTEVVRTTVPYRKFMIDYRVHEKQDFNQIGADEERSITSHVM